MVKERPGALPGNFRPPFRVRRLGILLRLHRRAEWVQQIFQQIRNLKKSKVPEIFVSVMMDRPTPDVVIALNRAVEKLPNSITYEVLGANKPILSGAHGEQWMSTLRTQYAHLLESFDAQAAMVWDDDMLLTKAGVKELQGFMLDMSSDRYEALSLFFWDKRNTYNANMEDHWSTILFRCYPEDDFPLNYVVACPEAVSRSTHVKRLHHPLLNYGYLSPEDRTAAWDAAKTAGRVDAFTLHLLEQAPTLKIWQSNGNPQSASKPSSGSPLRTLQHK